MREIEIYQAHLDRVSRSFALCIKKLPFPMRNWISLSYLLCRVLDTIEDSKWESYLAQDQHYQQFEAFMQTLPKQQTVASWISGFPEKIPSGEKLLLEDSYFIFEDFHRLPQNVKAAMRTSVIRMSTGMRFYSKRKESDGLAKISDLIDVNRYCYFVAGVVGELLTRLFLVYRPDFKPQPGFLRNAFHFGIFLQKINILKDQHLEEREARFLVPDRQVVLASIQENARGALEYLLALPEEEKGYRSFCGWSLFLGLASLPWMQKEFLLNDGSKIPRSATEDLLAAIEEIIHDNAVLKETWKEYLPLFPAYPKAFENETLSTLPGKDRDWFHQLSGNVLTPTDLAELRLA